MDITLIVLIIGWVLCLVWVPVIIAMNKNVHPKALFILFFAEMWERFSFYGMRALLTLYMAKVLFAHMSQQNADERSLAIYGSYTALVYLFPVIGGLLADRFLGFKRAIIGGALMMFGHFTLALQGLEMFADSQVIFFAALALIITGNGYFKPNISSFLGEFYEPDDDRKDSAFTIFYMGINVGALLATLTCGYVGETINWHLGFGLAGIGMLFGLLVFLFNQKVFDDKGKVPDNKYTRTPVFANFKSNHLILIGTLLIVPLFALLMNFSDVLNNLLLLIGLGILGYLIWYGYSANSRAEGQRLWVVIVLATFNIVFWALFEQAGGALTLFADRNIDRDILGATIPASTLQSFNPLFIILLAPLFSWIWRKLSKIGREPSTPMKFVLGLVQLAMGFGVIVWAGHAFSTNGIVPLVFLAIMYCLHTTGELSLSPVGLSMVTKLSPAKIVGFVMGVWFLSFSFANKLAGIIGELTATEQMVKGAPPTETLEVYTGVFLNWGVFAVLGAAILLLLLVPILRKWMHGIH